MECWTCKSNTGEKRISPGPTIFEGKYWLVEHAYPVKAIGWLIIVLKRHAEVLHELTAEEFTELAQIQVKLTHFCMKNSIAKRNIFPVMLRQSIFIIFIFMSLPNHSIFRMN